MDESISAQAVVFRNVNTQAFLGLYVQDTRFMSLTPK